MVAENGCSNASAEMRYGICGMDLPVGGQAIHLLERTEMKNLLMRLWKEEEGQDLTEYALLLVLVALAAIGSLSTLASAINNVFSSAASNLSS